MMLGSNLGCYKITRRDEGRNAPNLYFRFEGSGLEPILVSFYIFSLYDALGY
jgi:hypothetical protein